MSQRLANERHELYALHRAKGMSPSKAGIAAGFASGSSTPSELEKDGAVISRIDELIEELRTKREASRAAAIEAAKVVGQMTGVSKAWVITKLAENAQMAAQDGQFKESNEALRLIGDEFGMFKGGAGGDDPNAESANQMNIGDVEHMLGGTPGDDAMVPLAAPKDPSHLDAAMALIEGQGARARPRRGDEAAKARELSTGSETDVALTEDAEPEAEQVDGWRRIDPRTTPEELMRHVEGDIELPEFQPEGEHEDEDDEPAPPRRSQRGQA